MAPSYTSHTFDVCGTNSTGEDAWSFCPKAATDSSKNCTAFRVCDIETDVSTSLNAPIGCTYNPTVETMQSVLTFGSLGLAIGVYCLVSFFLVPCAARRMVEKKSARKHAAAAAGDSAAEAAEEWSSPAAKELRDQKQKRNMGWLAVGIAVSMVTEKLAKQVKRQRLTLLGV